MLLVAFRLRFHSDPTLVIAKSKEATGATNGQITGFVATVTWLVSPISKANIAARRKVSRHLATSNIF